MIYVLIKFEDNWADEFDMHGFKVTTKEKWDAYITSVKNDVSFPQELYFGTNEAFEWNSAEEYLKCFKVSEITATEYEIFKKYFEQKWRREIIFGEFPEIEEALYPAEDEE